MFVIYIDYFNLPYPHYESFIITHIEGAVISIATGLAATYMGVKQVLEIQPAEAMRPAAPQTYHYFNIPFWINKRPKLRQKIEM